MTDDVDLGVSWGKTDPAETPGNWRDQAHILELTDRKAQELTRLENTLAAALQALGELAAQAKAAGISEDRMLREVSRLGYPPLVNRALVERAYAVVREAYRAPGKPV
jgi:hypothetical protein